MGQRLRTFVAVEIPPAVGSRVRQLVELLSVTPAHVRWVEERHFHWTLKFLGEINYREVGEVCRAVEQAAKGVEPFMIEARGAGAFPTSDRPRTVWLGVGEGAEQMVTLHDAVEVALAELGVRREGRRFRPHLTLGRVRNTDAAGLEDLRQRLEAQAQFPAGRMEVDELTVFSSRLEREGPVYEVLGTAPLG